MPQTNVSVIRALDILAALGDVSPEPLRLQEIAQRVDLPESTTHRLLASLAERGYVRQRGNGGPYGLGWEVVLLAQSLDDEVRLVRETHTQLEKLAHQVGATANLGILDGASVVYLDCVVPASGISLYVPPGTEVPVYATALGKVLLAGLPETELDQLLSELQIEALTPRTITSTMQLKEVLDEVRQRGYATDYGEFSDSVTCIAALISDPTGRTVAAISVTARIIEPLRDWEMQTAPLVVASAQKAVRCLFG